jgi:hypothetical protein
MEERKLNAFGEWYKLVHTCTCGSEKLYKRWVLDENDRRLFTVCEVCEERKIKAHENSLRNNGREPPVRP